MTSSTSKYTGLVQKAPAIFTCTQPGMPAAQPFSNSPLQLRQCLWEQQVATQTLPEQAQHPGFK